MDVASQAFNCRAKLSRQLIFRNWQPLKRWSWQRLKARSCYGPGLLKNMIRKEKKIYFTDKTSLDADLVIISIGEVPILDFLPPSVHTEKGWIVVNDIGQTSDVKALQ